MWHGDKQLICMDVPVGHILPLGCNLSRLVYSIAIKLLWKQGSVKFSCILAASVLLPLFILLDLWLDLSLFVGSHLIWLTIHITLIISFLKIYPTFH